MLACLKKWFKRDKGDFGCSLSVQKELSAESAEQQKRTIVLGARDEETLRWLLEQTGCQMAGEEGEVNLLNDALMMIGCALPFVASGWQLCLKNGDRYASFKFPWMEYPLRLARVRNIMEEIENDPEVLSALDEGALEYLEVMG